MSAKVPDDKLRLAATLYAEGKTMHEIAPIIERSVNRVSQWLRRDEALRIIEEARPQVAAIYAMRALEYVANEANVIEGTPLLVQYGIAMDKHLKATQGPNPNTPNDIRIQINIGASATNPDGQTLTIDAEPQP